MANIDAVAAQLPVEQQADLTRLPAIKAAVVRAQVVDDALEAQLDGTQYLPKGKLESSAEYETRLKLTYPVSQTAPVLNGRMGQMFASPPELQGDSDAVQALRGWLNQAGLGGQTLLDVAAQLAALQQRHGMVAVVVDYSPVPGPVSQEERQAGKGAPRLVIYSVYNLVKFRRGPSGLESLMVWEEPAPGVLRTVEFLPGAIQRRTYKQPAPLANPQQWVLSQTEETLTGNQQLPVYLFCPFPRRDGTGQAALQSVARSDLAATRVLSDIGWCLYLVGNPILVMNTNRTAKEIQDVAAAGSGRYMVLKSKNGVVEKEELAFVTLGVEGLKQQQELLEKFRQLGVDSTGRSEVAATTVQAQSGVSRAWQFKTGEGRILFALQFELEKGLNWLLDHWIAPAYGVEASKARLVFHDDFADEVPVEVILDQTGKMLDLAQRLNSPTLKRAAVEAMASALKLNSYQMESILAESQGQLAEDPVIELADEGQDLEAEEGPAEDTPAQ